MIKPLLDWCPSAPAYQLEWDAMTAAFDWLAAMKDCPQDALHHAEGNVWIHTRMVCEALLANETWRSLPREAQQMVFVAALLHDVAKPLCTREEEGRITSRGHSKRGEILARYLLWQDAVPFATREQIASLIRWHQVPFFLIESDDALRKLFTVSQTARNEYLALVAEADAHGRISESKQRIIDNTALFAQFAFEHGCWHQPRQFANAHSRFEYFSKPDRDPDYAAFDNTKCEVIVMSGLPGSGKDHWIATQAPDWPVVSLDALRRERKVAPTENQGVIIAAAREQARVHLRKQQSFIWNATNLSRTMREPILSLCAAYHARIRIVYIETSAEKLFTQNRERQHSVPGSALQRMFEKWEVPDLTEAHEVEFVIN